MMRTLLIDGASENSTCALLEDGILAEYWRHAPSGGSDGILLGRVQNLVPHLEAAFVDTGEDKHAFLPVCEKGLPPPRPGQEVLVQVQGTPGGAKGKRVTRAITLAGRLLTLLTEEAGVCAVSAKIDGAKREALLSLMQSVCPKEVGWILRTAAKDATKDEIAEEAQALLSRWQAIKQRAKSAIPPCPMDEGGAEWVDVRDLLPLPLDEIIVSGREAQHEIRTLLEEARPQAMPKLTPCDEKNLLSAYGVSRALERALSRKAWLPGGGQLVFDACEAMTVIDVNAAKYQGHGSQEESFLRLNLEAAQETARQIRLRDIGGIIVIDFVDMREKPHRQVVWDALEQAMGPDRGKHTLVDMSSLCLLQLTRKPLHQPLDALFCSPCPACGGAGFIHAGKDTP